MKEHLIIRAQWAAWVLTGLLLFALISPAAAQDEATNPETVAVRSADHATYSRVVFDFRRHMPYQAALDGETLEVRFVRPVDIDFGRLAAKPLAAIANPSAATEDGATVIRFDVPAEARLRHFRDGTKIVLDALGSGHRADDALLPEEIAQLEALAEAVLVESQAPAPETTEAEPPAAAEPVSDQAEQPEPAELAKNDAPAEPEAEAPQPAPVTETSEPTPAPAGKLVLTAKDEHGVATLSFAWDRLVAAAIFQRAGHLWIVFEEPAPIDARVITELPGDRFRTAERVSHPRALVLHSLLRPGQFVDVARDATTWHVTVADSPAHPPKPLAITRQPAGDGTIRLFVPVEEVGGRFALTDPAAGDRLVVVTVPGAAGFVDKREFQEFTILATAQGVAVAPKADSVLVERFPEGVAINGAGGLALSENVPGDRMNGAYGGPKRYFDFAAWGQTENGPYSETKNGLLYALSMAPADDRNPARWDLARFYLAHGLASDARAVLSLMAEDDASLETNPDFLAIRGVANFRLRRFESARSDLDSPALESEPDIYLWRTAVAQALGDSESALAHYRRADGSLTAYSETERVPFQFAAAEAALAMDRLDIVKRELDYLDGYNLPLADISRINYLKGALERAHDKRSAALAHFDQAAESTSRRTAAESEYARVTYRLEADEITAEDAIDRLERLRFAWRGDAFELELLDRLGRLYVDKGDYRAGLYTLRQAASNFPKSATTRNIASAMAEIFATLFLAGEAEKLPAVQALALYYDFRELTPLGADGDTMIRRLSDRLVSVDLLDKAAELLDHQVNFRLEGAAQAQIASKLAMVYLMDGKPEQAIATLRATRHGGLTTDVSRQRLLVEARALIELARYEEAEVLLEDESSEDAELLRADLYWGSKDWPRVAAHSAERLDGRWRDEAPLGVNERRQLIRHAIALSLMDDRDGLADLRGKFFVAMRDGQLGNAFDLITADEVQSADKLTRLAESIASVDRLQSFMAAYREEFSTASQLISQTN